MLLRRVSRTRFIDGQTGVVACCLLAAGCWLLVVAVERLQLQLSFRRQKNKNLPARIRPEANFCSNIADAFQKKKKETDRLMTVIINVVFVWGIFNSQNVVRMSWWISSVARSSFW